MCSPACCWCWRWRLRSTPRSNGSRAKAAIWQTGSRAGQRAADEITPAPSSLRPDGVRVFDLTLTFDNGPEPGVTRTCSTSCANAISDDFFVIGREAWRILNAASCGARPWRRPLDRQSYFYAFGTSRAATRRRDRANEIGRTQAAIGDLAHPYRWFRPVRGGGNRRAAVKPSVVEYSRATSIARDLERDPRDWDDPTAGSTGAHGADAFRSRGA